MTGQRLDEEVKEDGRADAALRHARGGGEGLRERAAQLDAGLPGRREGHEEVGDARRDARVLEDACERADVDAVVRFLEVEEQDVGVGARLGPRVDGLTEDRDVLLG